MAGKVLFLTCSDEAMSLFQGVEYYTSMYTHILSIRSLHITVHLRINVTTQLNNQWNNQPAALFG